MITLYEEQLVRIETNWILQRDNEHKLCSHPEKSKISKSKNYEIGQE